MTVQHLPERSIEDPSGKYDADRGQVEFFGGACWSFPSFIAQGDRNGNRLEAAELEQPVRPKMKIEFDYDTIEPAGHSLGSAAVEPPHWSGPGLGQVDGEVSTGDWVVGSDSTVWAYVSPEGLILPSPLDAATATVTRNGETKKVHLESATRELVATGS